MTVISLAVPKGTRAISKDLSVGVEFIQVNDYGCAIALAAALQDAAERYLLDREKRGE